MRYKNPNDEKQTYLYPVMPVGMPDMHPGKGASIFWQSWKISIHPL